MGSWGAGILQDDSAMDIIGDYRILLGYKVPNDEAYKLIKEYYYPDFKGSDDEDIFWFALAIYQLRNGILIDEVKENAFKFLENPSSLDVWKESGKAIYENRLKVLAKLKEELLTPSVTKPKRIPKPPAYIRCKTNYREGDLLAVEIQADWLKDEENKYNYNKDYIGKFFLARIVIISKYPLTKLKPELDYRTQANVAVYDWLGTKIPYAESLDNIKLMGRLLGLCEDEELYKYSVVISNDVNYKDKDKFKYLTSRFGSYPSLVRDAYDIFEALRKQGEKFEALGD